MPWVMLPSYAPGGWPLREWGQSRPPQQALEGGVSLRKGLSLFWFLDSGSGRLLADFLPARRPCASVGASAGLQHGRSDTGWGSPHPSCTPAQFEGAGGFLAPPAAGFCVSSEDATNTGFPAPSDGSGSFPEPPGAAPDPRALPEDDK